MSFNFEKHIPKVEKTPEPVETELSEQEKFEQECILEAKKLDLNIAGLKSQIDAHGGIDKFTEYFENDGKGKRMQHELNMKIGSAQFNVSTGKMIGILSAFLTTIGVGTAVLSGEFNYLVSSPSLIGLYSLINAVPAGISIAGYFKGRSLKREHAKNELKFKMTGVDGF